MSVYVTRTGRAKSPGRVTRASTLVRTRAKGQIERPLPIHLQCHPKALTPTSHNPYCTDRKLWTGMARYMAATWTTSQIMKGKGLETSGKWELRITERDVCLGWTDDINFAMAFARAAEVLGINVEVLE